MTDTAQVRASTTRLAGRVVIVTGGTAGIGAAITERLLLEGASVMVGGLDTEAVETALQRFGATDRAAGFVGDLVEPETAGVLVRAALDRFGRLDVLVNNAGFGVIAPTLEHTEETLQATINNNLWTNLRCSLAALPVMVDQGGGRIVNIGAESVRNGLTDHAVYNAAKGGVHGLTVGLAREFAPNGITVNAVAPSYIRTPEISTMIDEGRASPRFLKVAADAVSWIPLGRPGSAEDVAGAVAYLASDDAAFVTGQIISVNGGSSMQ